jgi:hypothetical protein
MADESVILLSGGFKLPSQLAAFPPRSERRVGAGIKQEAPKECDLALSGMAWNGQVILGLCSKAFKQNKCKACFTLIHSKKKCRLTLQYATACGMLSFIPCACAAPCPTTLRERTQAVLYLPRNMMILRMEICDSAMSLFPATTISM